VIPLVHDFERERVLVFGGGPVGARKARRFAREATVVVVSPSFTDADFGGAQRVRAAPDAETARAWIEASDPALVVAATDDSDLNDALARAAREQGTLWNRADERGSRPAGSVVVPATVRDDPVVAAISTGGTSPALSRHLRERVADTVDGASAMARLTGRLRDRLHERNIAADRRRDAVRAVVAHEGVWTALDTSEGAARERAAGVVSEVTGQSWTGGDFA
jgi:precorrin-2 dehydrogenase/sirohydrochlorin ferrochelatase